jgi:alpha-tubulin suppressor-like RCC1 family protein
MIAARLGWGAIACALLFSACSDGPRPCRFTSISAGAQLTLGVSEDGALWQWGDPGQYYWHQLRLPAPRQIRSTDDIVAVTTRTDAVCEVHGPHGLLCWASGGIPMRDLADAPAVAMSLDETFQFASLEAHWNCALETDGAVRCWSDWESAATLEPAGLGAGMIDVALGDSARFEGCAVKDDHSLWCWGAGVVGDGSPARDDSAPATEILSLRGIAAQVALGVGGRCAVTTTGEVWCWGRAVDVVAPPLEPVRVALPVSAVRVGMGVGHACALTSDGAVWCWGENDRGQCAGAGPRSSTPAQVPIPGGAAALELAVGVRHTCARTAAAVYCWGDNVAGQLGNPDTLGELSTAPVVVAGCP